MKASSITGQVLPPDALSRSDQGIWREWLAPQPIAFLAYPYVSSIASCVPLVRICRVMQDGRTTAFFPFQYRSHAHAAAGIGERLAGELSDYFGLIAEPGFQIDAKTLLRLSGIKSLSFTHLDESQRGNGLIGDKLEIGHRIEFPHGGEYFWEERRRKDKKFVSDSERRERKLIREYGPMRFVFSEDNPHQLLDELITQKRAQYRRTRVPDVLGAKQTRDILHALCGIRDPHCSGILSTLRAGDTWVASHFGLRSGSTLHYWFPVYNVALKDFAPGRILLKQIMFSSQSHGLVQIDRGAGDSSAKRDFSTSHHFFSSGLWQRKSIASVTHRIGLALSWRMARYARQRGSNFE